MNNIIKKIKDNYKDILTVLAATFGSSLVILTVVMPMFSTQTLNILPRIMVKIIYFMTKIWWQRMLWEVTGWALMIIGLRKWVWQAELEDLKFVLPAFIMFFLIIYTYNFGKIIKTELIKGSKAIGMHYIPHLKIISSIVCSLYMIYYGGFVGKVESKHAVLLATAPLVAFYAFVKLFALKKTIAPGRTQDYVYFINDAFRLNLKNTWIPFKPLINNWVISLFYLLIEVWAAAVLVAFFWRTISRLIERRKAKKLIPAIMITAQISALLAASTSSGIKFTSYMGKINFFCTILVVCAMGIIAINYILFAIFTKSPIGKTKKKPVVKLSLLETIKKHPELLYLALINVFFGAIMATSEQFWRLIASRLYASNKAFEAFNGVFNKFQARASLLFAMFFANQAPRYFNWFVNAVPASIVGLGIGVITLGGYVVLSILRVPQVYKFKVICYVGAVLLIIFRALKFASVDPTKEWFVCNQDSEKQTMIKNLEGGISRYGKSLPSVIIMKFSIPKQMWSTGLVGFFSMFITGMSVSWLFGLKKIYESMSPDIRKSTIEQEKLATIKPSDDIQNNSHVAVSDIRSNNTQNNSNGHIAADVKDNNTQNNSHVAASDIRSNNTQNNSHVAASDIRSNNTQNNSNGHIAADVKDNNAQGNSHVDADVRNDNITDDHSYDKK